MVIMSENGNGVKKVVRAESEAHENGEKKVVRAESEAHENGEKKVLRAESGAYENREGKKERGREKPVGNASPGIFCEFKFVF